MIIGKKLGAAPRSTPNPQLAEALKVIEQVQLKSISRRDKNVKASSTKSAAQITKEEMQAIFDTHSTAVELGYRIIVTSKEYGFLRKRLAENPPANFSEFVRWMLTYWSTLATQNQNAVRKDKARLVKDKALPSAPHFSTVAYWYPYLFRCYTTNLAGKVVDTKIEDAKDSELKALRAKVARTSADMAVLRQRVSSRPAAVAPAPTRSRPRPAGIPTPVANPSIRDDDLFGDIVMPSWDEVSGKSEARK